MQFHLHPETRRHTALYSRGVSHRRQRRGRARQMLRDVAEIEVYLTALRDHGIVRL
jgi:hypothetical protein